MRGPFERLLSFRYLRSKRQEGFISVNAYADKPWETSLYVRKQVEDWAFTFLAKYDLFDFIAQFARRFAARDRAPGNGTLGDQFAPAVGCKRYAVETVFARAATDDAARSRHDPC